MFGVSIGRSGGGIGDGRTTAASAGRGGGDTVGNRGVGGDKSGPPTNILLAAYVGALDIVKTLVAEGQEADKPDLIKGSTPLHWASFGGHLDVVRWLVKEAGADVNRANKDGITPLMFACEQGHAGVAQWLFREGGAQVNVKDDVTWQTPLHRVCLNSQRRDREVSSVKDDEELALWLVEAGADLGAVDRFGNHVEELRTPTPSDSKAVLPDGTAESTCRSSVCEMISAAREEGGTTEGARDNLTRQRASRRRSASDTTVQLSPKLEAKQRTPGARRGLRKGGHAALESSQDFAVSKPMLARRGSGGSGGGAAAPTAGAAAARMGGGPPAPSADRGEEENREDAVASTAAASAGGVDAAEPEGMGYMNEMVAIFGGGKVPGRETFHSHQSRRNSGDRDQPHQILRMSSFEEAQTQQQSLRAADEALRRAGVPLSTPSAPLSARRKLDPSGQQVVEKIRELSMRKSAGEISEKEFSSSKRQLLEMEQLRREAEDEARRRAEGKGEEDAGVAILTSVGQNTPPPSPKGGSGEEAGSDDDEGKPVSVLVVDGGQDGEKGGRETYKASDIDRYTTKNESSCAPRVFGEVPVSLKESLAAKEASSSFREAKIAAPAGAVGESASASAPAVELRSSSKKSKSKRHGSENKTSEDIAAASRGSTFTVGSGSSVRARLSAIGSGRRDSKEIDGKEGRGAAASTPFSSAAAATTTTTTTASTTLGSNIDGTAAFNASGSGSGRSGCHGCACVIA